MANRHFFLFFCGEYFLCERATIPFNWINERCDLHMENAENNSIVFDFCEIPLLLALFVGIFFYVFQQKSITVLLEAIVLNILNWWATVNTIAANERSFLHIIRLIQAIFQRRFVSIFIVCWNFSVHDWRLVQFFSVFYLVFESVQKIRPDLVWEVDDNVRKKKNFFSARRMKSNHYDDAIIRWAVEIGSKTILDVITFCVLCAGWNFLHFFKL